MVLTKNDVDDIVKLLLINNQKSLQGYVIGTLYFKIGEYDHALKYVSKYLQIQPSSFIAYKLQGECYEKVNRYDEALKSYGKGLNLVDKKKHINHSADSNNVENEMCREEVLREKIELLKSSSMIQKLGNKNTAVTADEMDPNVVETSHPATTPASTPAPSSETTFEYRVMHITSLDGSVCSEAFPFQNLLWSVVVVPKRDLGAYRTFSFYLMCMGDGNSSQWSCNVDAEFRLLSIQPNRCPHVQKTRHLFNKEADIWGFPTFMSWYDVVRADGNYMRDDCISVQVHLAILN